MPPVIELSHISKSFSQRTWRSLLCRRPRCVQALRDVNLTVESGEIMGLLGPNGAGKTTLIKILATLISPDAGQGAICGYPLSDDPQKIRAQIGLVNTNDRSFYWRLSGQDNLNFFAALYNLNGPDRDARVAEVLDVTGLAAKGHTPFHSYSAGQRQRLAIARALLADPAILFLDEPTNSLDPLASKALISFIRQTLVAEQGRSVLWCTHNLREAEAVCDCLTILDQGRVIHSGTSAELKALMAGKQYFELVVDQLPHAIGAALELMEPPCPGREGLRCRLASQSADCGDLVKKLVGAGVRIHELRKVEVSLEEVFSQLVSSQGVQQ